MKLYKVPSAPVGERWQSQKAQAAKLGEVEEIDMPKAGRAGMADFLNANELEVARQPAAPLDEIEQAEMRAVAAAGGTTMSTGACPKCRFTPKMAHDFVDIQMKSLTMEALEERVHQLDGWELGRVLATGLNKARELAKALGSKEPTSGS